MRGTIAFNKTVIGHKHIIKDIPCEDCSGSYSDKNGIYEIAMIADGHGDPSCFRSQSGSAFAVETTMACLKEFAEYWSGRLEEFNALMESERDREF